MRGTKDTFSGRFWVNVSILGLCTIGLLGLLLRSKIVFSIPFINYNHFVEAHSRFTFSGWVTLALMLLMVSELLPESGNKKIYYTVCRYCYYIMGDDDCFFMERIQCLINYRIVVFYFAYLYLRLRFCQGYFEGKVKPGCPLAGCLIHDLPGHIILRVVYN